LVELRLRVMLGIVSGGDLLFPKVVGYELAGYDLAAYEPTVGEFAVGYEPVEGHESAEVGEFAEGYELVEGNQLAAVTRSVVPKVRWSRVDGNSHDSKGSMHLGEKQ